MPANRFYIFTLIVLLLVFGFLSYHVLKPFLSPIAWAIVLGIIFYPVYIFIRKGIKWKAASSIMTIVIIISIILGPFSYLSILLGKELSGIAEYLEDGKLEKIKDVLSYPSAKWIVDKIQIAFHLENVDVGSLLVENVSKVGKELLTRLTVGVKNILNAFVNFIFMVISLFFIFRDGSKFIEKIRDSLPFSERQKDRLASQIRDMSISTIYGGVVVAIIQGTIGGTAFFFLGIKAPVIWGTAIAIMSFIPMLGTFSIWGPICFFLFLNGSYGKGIILLIVGTFGISMVDNILKPIIISGRTKMPTLMIFFSVIGGIKLFGLIGLIMGPLVVVLFISLFEIFRSIEGGNSVNP